LTVGVVDVMTYPAKDILEKIEKDIASCLEGILLIAKFLVAKEELPCTNECNKRNDNSNESRDY